MQHQIKATECSLREDGLFLAFSDGKSFLYPVAFLFATRFTHARVVPEDRASSAAKDSSTEPSLNPS